MTKTNKREREYETKLTIILFVHGAGDFFAVVQQQSAIQTPLLITTPSQTLLPLTSYVNRSALRSRRRDISHIR